MSTSSLTPSLTASFLEHKHSLGLSYADYLETSPDKKPKWLAVHEKLRLTKDQTQLISSFTRRMNIICLSGMWCGDCSSQGPMLAHIAAANPDHINLRWLDRDEHLDLADLVKINAGLRVPTVIFLAEDFEFVSLFADRTLARYRAVAAKQLGPSCPLPGADIPADELAATL
ncbi:MAG TPA: thioredoxin family protein, partial [Phycisphaerales bacterium]|nr:thioredoxin family protein [Phycisphaerales bacterium]